MVTVLGHGGKCPSNGCFVDASRAPWPWKSKSRFTHETKGFRNPLHVKISHWSKKGRDRSSSLRTRRCRPKGSKKWSWTESLRWFLHGGLWVTFHGWVEFVSGPPPRGSLGADFGSPCQLNNLWFLEESQGPSQSRPFARVWIYLKEALNTM